MSLAVCVTWASGSLAGRKRLTGSSARVPRTRSNFGCIVKLAPRSSAGKSWRYWWWYAAARQPKINAIATATATGLTAKARTANASAATARAKLTFTPTYRSAASPAVAAAAGNVSGADANSRHPATRGRGGSESSDGSCGGGNI